MIKKKGKTSKITFVALTWGLLNNKAYKELPFSAKAALPYFLGKTKRFPAQPDYHEIEFAFPYSEAKNLGFSRGTFFGVIKNLVNKGFIDPVRRGGKRGFGYSNSLFKLSKRWEAYGTYLFVKREWVETIPEISIPMQKTELYKSKNRLDKGSVSSVCGLAGGKNAHSGCSVFRQ